MAGDVLNMSELNHKSVVHISNIETHPWIVPYQTPKLDAESGSSLQTKADVLASATFGLEVLKLNPRTLHPGIRNLRMLEVVFRFFLM